MIHADPPWHGLNHATHQNSRPGVRYEQWFAYQRSYVDTFYAGPHLRIMQVPQRYDTTVSATEDTGPHPVLHPYATTGRPMIVGMHLFQHATLTTYDEDGRVHRYLTQRDEEYNIYATAHRLYPHCASAGYDLLRFGRVLGPDALHPQDRDSSGRHTHFREVYAFTENGSLSRGWINLYDDAIHVFSDADFAPNFGWHKADDDADGDSRCDSDVVYQQLIRTWIDHNPDKVHAGVAAINALSRAIRAALRDPLQNAGSLADSANAVKHVLDRAQITELLNDEAVQARLGQVVCKFPSEWDFSQFDSRWSWLSRDPIQEDAASPGDGTPRLTPEQMQTFKAHAQALCFWEQAKEAGYLELDANHWHIDPRVFIKQFRKCGWYSLDELAQLIPREPGNIPWRVAKERFKKYQITLNKCLQKYALHFPARLAQFAAQVYQETGCIRQMTEFHFGIGHSYGSFYGRGIMQLTWPKNYADYGAYRNFAPNTSGTYLATGNSTDPVTDTSVHEWSNGSDKKQWSPRYDPNFIASDTFSACDSGGYFWITKHYAGTSNINRLIDTGFNTDTVGKASVLINGGENGYNERQGYAAYVYRHLSDSVDGSASESLSFTIYGIKSGRWLAHRSASIQVDFTPQRK